MNLPLNAEEPRIMHIDLNSCFATVEQQARPRLRGRPVAVTNRKSRHAAVIIAASYEAKAAGIKVGMRTDEAMLLEPGLIIVETDPPKYHYVYQRLVGIMRSYSPDVVMKSIDEGIIDFHSTSSINKQSLKDIGMEIKERLKREVGIWMRCNIGIAPNRFLAKQAASLHKPDGLDTISHSNLRAVLKTLQLTDLTGIAICNQARLNAVGIYTPLQFLDASADDLRRRVFHSVCGEDWYKRLRGWEVDNYDSITKTVGRQYVLEDVRLSEQDVDSRLSYLCETTGLKLRSRNLCARGLYVYARYTSGDFWYERRMFKTTFYSTAEIYRRALLLFNNRPKDSYIQEIGVTCYGLELSHNNQISLLDEVNHEVWLTQAMDCVNEKYGESTLIYATSFPSRDIIKQKVPFGSTRYFELLCQS